MFILFYGCVYVFAVKYERNRAEYLLIKMYFSELAHYLKQKKMDKVRF